MNTEQQGIYRERHEHTDRLFSSTGRNDHERETHLPPSRTHATRRTSNATSSKKKKENFPFVLMHMLQTIEMEEPQLACIVSWTPDGTTFQIHDKTRFENEIQPRYFKQSSYSSFRRQLNIWGFKAVGDRKTKETTALYGHPLFLRDNPKLCYAIARKGAKGSLSDLYPQIQYDYSANQSSSFHTGFSCRSSESNSAPSAKSSSEHETSPEDAKSSKSEPYQFYDKISLQKEKKVQLFQDPVAKYEGKGPGQSMSNYEITFPSTSYDRVEDSSDAIHRPSFSYPLQPHNIQRQTSTPHPSSFQVKDNHFSQERLGDSFSSNTFKEPTHEATKQSLELLQPQSEPMSFPPPTTSSSTCTNIENVLSQIQEIDRQTAQLDQQFDPSKLHSHKRRPSLFSSFSYPLLQNNSQSAVQFPSFRSVQESSSESSPYFEVQDDTPANANRSASTLPTVLLDEVEPIHDEEEIKPIPPIFGNYMKQLLSSKSTHDNFRRESPKEE